MAQFLSDDGTRARFRMDPGEILQMYADDYAEYGEVHEEDGGIVNVPSVQAGPATDTVQVRLNQSGYQVLGTPETLEAVLQDNPGLVCRPFGGGISLLTPEAEARQREPMPVPASEAVPRVA